MGGGTVTAEIYSETPQHPHLIRKSHDPQYLHELPPHLPSLPPPSLSLAHSCFTPTGSFYVSLTHKAQSCPRAFALTVLSRLGRALPPLHAWLLYTSAQMSPSGQEKRHLPVSIIITHPLPHRLSPLPLFSPWYLPPRILLFLFISLPS